MAGSRRCEDQVWNGSLQLSLTQHSVDVSEVARLRKLRKTEEDTVLSGTELSTRLRGQFEKIYGKPAWAETDGMILADANDINTL